MSLLNEVLRNTSLATAPEAVGLLLLILLLLIVYALRARAGQPIPLRPLGAYEALKEVMGQAVEMGRSVHVSAGLAGLGQATTAETLAGLAVLEYLADQPTVGYVSPVATTADATLLPAAQDALRRGHWLRGYQEKYQAGRGRFVAPGPAPYAAGVAGLLERENLAANVMVGAFGDEFLLMSEPANRKGLLQIGGAANPQALPFVWVSVDHPLIGEEIFAAGAYLSGRPAHLGSPKAHDWVRLLIIAVILVTVFLKTMGFGG